jgi:hypothetical protein
LVNAGFPPRDAVRAFYSLLTYVFGFVLWELPRVHQQPADAYVAAWDASLAALDPAEYPHLHSLRDTLVTTASDDQFEYGLQHLVNAIDASRGAGRRGRARRR